MEEISPKTYEKYIKALRDISLAITSDLYLEDILKLIVMVTAKVTGVEICSLWLIDDSQPKKTIRLKATQAIEPAYLKDRTISADEGVVGYVASHNEPLILKDVLKDPRFKEKEMARKMGLVSMVSVPLEVKNEKVIGRAQLFYRRATRFSGNRDQSHQSSCQSGGRGNSQHGIHGSNQSDPGGTGGAKAD